MQLGGAQRGDVEVLVFIKVKSGAQSQLVRPHSQTPVALTPGNELSGRSEKTIPGDRIRVLCGPTQINRLHVEIAGANPCSFCQADSGRLDGEIKDRWNNHHAVVGPA